MSTSVHVQKLVAGAQQGDPNCFEELFKQYYKNVYAFCFSILKNAFNAEDAAQNTFITAWQKLPQLTNTASFDLWLLVIARNHCYRMLEREHFVEDIDEISERELLAEDELFLPEVYLSRVDLSDRLKRIIFHLSNTQRQTILLYYYQGLSIKEIAAVCNCSENTVKSRLYLARQSIRVEIEEQERKTGEKFFGIVGIPVLAFGKIYANQLSASLPRDAETALQFERVKKELYDQAMRNAKTDSASEAEKKVNAEHQKQKEIQKTAHSNKHEAPAETAKTKIKKPGIIKPKVLAACITAAAVGVAGVTAAIVVPKVINKDDGETEASKVVSENMEHTTQRYVTETDNYFFYCRNINWSGEEDGEPSYSVLRVAKEDDAKPEVIYESSLATSRIQAIDNKVYVYTYASDDVYTLSCMQEDGSNLHEVQKYYNDQVAVSTKNTFYWINGESLSVLDLRTEKKGDDIPFRLDTKEKVKELLLHAVEDNCLYYEITSDEGESRIGTIYRLNLDTQETEELFSDSIHAAPALGVDVIKHRCYYKHENELRCYDTDNKKMYVIEDTLDDDDSVGYCIENDTVYYLYNKKYGGDSDSGSAYDYNYYVYRCNYDGSDKTRISELSYSSELFRMGISGNKLVAVDVLAHSGKYTHLYFFVDKDTGDCVMRGIDEGEEV